jgi:hypothetical protein
MVYEVSKPTFVSVANMKLALTINRGSMGSFTCHQMPQGCQIREPNWWASRGDAIHCLNLH